MPKIFFIKKKLRLQSKKGCSISKGQSESINRNRTDNAMIFKTLHRKLNIKENETHYKAEINTGDLGR